MLPRFSSTSSGEYLNITPIESPEMRKFRQVLREQAAFAKLDTATVTHPYQYDTHLTLDDEDEININFEKLFEKRKPTIDFWDQENGKLIYLTDDKFLK